MYARFKYIPRLTPLPVPPATVPVNNIPRAGKGKSYPLSDRWVSFIKSINTEQGVRNVLNPSRGWVNAWQDSGRPVAESLSMGGNVAEIEYIEGNFAKLVTLKPDSPLPSADNYLLVHMQTAVTWTGQPRLFGAGLRTFFPFIINGDAWVGLGSIDVFTMKPEPFWPGGAPQDMAGYPAVVVKRTVVRQSPDGVKVYVMEFDTVVRVSSEVKGWAKIGDKRWVPLSAVRPI